MVNRVILIGNLGQNPQVRTTQSESVVTSFSMATSRRWNDSSGKRQEKTEWHQIVCFGRLAEVAAEYLVKGRQVYVEGRLQTSSWEDRETGDTRYRTEIVCENLQMLGQRGNGGAAEAETTEVEDPAEPPAKKPAAKKKPRRRAAKKSS